MNEYRSFSVHNPYVSFYSGQKTRDHRDQVLTIFSCLILHRIFSLPFLHPWHNNLCLPLRVLGPDSRFAFGVLLYFDFIRNVNPLSIRLLPPFRNIHAICYIYVPQYFQTISNVLIVYPCLSYRSDISSTFITSTVCSYVSLEPRSPLFRRDRLCSTVQYVDRYHQKSVTDITKDDIISGRLNLKERTEKREGGITLYRPL